MRHYKEHLILKGTTVLKAMAQLNILARDAILFVVDENDTLIGSLTDGDVRRGLLKDFSVQDEVEKIIQPNPRYIEKGDYRLEQIIEFRKGHFKIIPIIDANRKVVNIINLRELLSYLPVDVVIMAGGRGSRLQPMTDTTPKPLLKVGDKTIIRHNLDRLKRFGMDDFWISIRYLGEQIEEHLGNGTQDNITIDYVWEDKPLGTIGAVSKIKNFQHDYVLVTNSDILTTLDYEDFFLDFISRDADMSVATIPYNVDVPYAVLETENNEVLSFKEKPTYTYYSNGGIYLIKRKVLERIPKDEFYNSTDLMEDLLKNNGKLISYPMRTYWLDIGKPQDFVKAQEDIKHLDL
ncbi:nucleotidyltransferase [Roseivirga seohaensis]|uniref:Nucleotidyltransferase n=1 Tax=Roseivirga seohaensis TaxID=1914963 RepID=A0A150XMA4_9BACT|nr:nucleotidyltransferase family protein [Roseivirga seohaensis]KYG79876.1 nucleotidyltransferase [Roseivirga seohaensis]